MVSCKYSEKLNYKEIFNFLSYNRIPLTLAVYKATTGGGKCHKGHNGRIEYVQIMYNTTLSNTHYTETHKRVGKNPTLELNR